MDQAEHADATDSDPQALPEALARRETLKAKLDEACARLEADAKAQAEAARSAYEKKKAVYDAKTGRRGRAPKPPDDEPPPDRQISLADGQLHEVEVGVGVDHARHLVLRWRMTQGRGCVAVQPLHEEVLATSVSALYVNYWGGNPAAWRDKWQGGLPELLTFHIVSEGSPSWPEITIHPLLAEGDDEGT